MKTNIVAAITITDGTEGDSPQFRSLIQRISQGFTIKEVSADMAYSSRENLNLVNSIGGIPYIPFKKNSTNKQRGFSMWIKMLHYFQFNKGAGFKIPTTHVFD